MTAFGGESPIVSVIMPALNEELRIGAALRALAEQSFPRSLFEVIVVDGGSTDRTREVALEHGARVVECEPGVGRQRNRGVELSRGPILAFLDADCVPSRDWLEKGLSHWRLGTEGDAPKSVEELDLKRRILVGGKILPPADEGTWIQRAWRVHMLARVKRALAVFSNEPIPREAALFLHTANLFISRVTFEEVGGFEESVHSGEDTLFATTAYVKGVRLHYDGELCVEHLAEPESSWKFFRQQLWHSNQEVWRAIVRLGVSGGARARFYGVIHAAALLAVALGSSISVYLGVPWVAALLVIGYLGGPFLLAWGACRRAGAMREVFALTWLYLLFGWARAAYLLGWRSVRRKVKG